MIRRDIIQAVQRAFDTLGPLAAHERSETNRIILMLAFLDHEIGGLKGKRILELGSSVGVHLLAAKYLGAAETVGIDKFVFPDEQDNAFRLPQQHVEELQTIWRREGIETVKHDVGAPWPFPNARFDLVVSNAMLEHCHGTHRHIFVESHRVLVPGGWCAFSTPNLAMLLKRVRFLFGRSPLWDFRDYFMSGQSFTGHVREFTVPEARSMLAWSGFEGLNVFSRPTYFRWSWFLKPHKWHHLLFQACSLLSPRWGDLIFAIGRKPA